MQQVCNKIIKKHRFHHRLKFSKRQLMLHSFTITGLFFYLLSCTSIFTNILSDYHSYVDLEYMARTGGFFNDCLTSCIPIASILIAVFYSLQIISMLC